MLKSKNAFTLIEVMVSVVIISIVIAALLQMFSNNTHIFLSFKNKIKVSQYSSFFLSSENYGFEDEKIDLYRLVEECDVEDEIRRELKDIKAEIIYQELDRIDMSDFEASDEEADEEVVEEESQEEEKEVNSNIVFEVGKSILRAEDSSVSLLRIRVQ